MDMNPFANNQPQQQSMTPDYLKQDKNGTTPGVISNMVKALVDGNNRFQARNPAQANAGGAPGAPLSLAPDSPGPSAPMTGAAPMSGTAPQMAQTQTATPFETGASPLPFASGPAPGVIAANGSAGMPGMPNGVDPTINALFSPIPGGQFGG